VDWQAAFSKSIAASEAFVELPIAWHMMAARMSARCRRHRSSSAVQSSERRIAMLSGPAGDVNRSLSNTDRAFGIRIRRPIGNRDHGPSAMCGHNDNGISNATRFGRFNAALKPWIEVALDDRRDGILSEQLRVQCRSAFGLSCIVVHAENQVAAAMVGERREVARKVRPCLDGRGIHP
jgi:hypothetical protein